MHVSMDTQSVTGPMDGRRFSPLLTTLLLLVSLLSTSCSLMKQSRAPSATGSTDNTLSASVKLIPVNARTLKAIVNSSDQKTAKRQQVPGIAGNWQYQIGAGDVLSIVVWDHPQLTIPAGPQRTPQEAGNSVSPEGTIFYPYIGMLKVAGKGIGEVRTAVASGLQNVIPNPQVDVSIARFSSQQVYLLSA